MTASVKELHQQVLYTYTQGIMSKCLIVPIFFVNIVTEFNAVNNLNFPTLLLKKKDIDARSTKVIANTLFI